MKRAAAVILISVLMVCSLLVACKSDSGIISTDQGSESADSRQSTEADRTQSNIPSTSKETEANRTTIESTTKEENDAILHLRWAVSPFYPITEEAQTKIRSVLEKKGISCIIDYVEIDPDAMGKEAYEEWVNVQKANDRAPDINFSGFWERGGVDRNDFLKRENFPLNDFLASESGHELYEAYTEWEWKQNILDGKIFTIPSRNPDIYMGEWYIYINDQYKDIVEEVYDGSFQSLSKITKMYPDKKLHIVTEVVNRDYFSLWDEHYSDYMASYSEQSDEFHDQTRLSETKELLQQFYLDLSDGTLVQLGAVSSHSDEALIEDLPEDTLVYMEVGLMRNLEGYSVTPMQKKTINTKIGQYGPSSSSSQIDLVLQVLSACYSDPETASLINWRYEDVEGWKKRTESLRTGEPSPLLGFAPTLSEEQKVKLFLYYNDLGNLMNSLFLQKHGEWYLNPDYQKYLDDFFGNPRDYGDVFEVINEQYKNWSADKTK